MNIGFVLDDSIFRHGGVQTALLTLASWLASRSQEVSIMHCPNPSVYEQPLDPRIEIIPIATGRDIRGLNFNGSVSLFPGFASSGKIREVLRTKKFDVLHFCYPFSPFVSGRVLRAVKTLRIKEGRRIKTIAAFQVCVEEKTLARLSNYALAWLLRPQLSPIDRFLHNSGPSRAYGLKYLGLESVKLANAIPGAPVAPKSRAGKWKLLFLGRLEVRKGVIDLLESLQKVRDRGVNLDSLEVCIAGDGPERLRAKVLAARYGLENVRFLGPVSEEIKHELYRTAHLAIFPARFGETFGLVLIEAMNFGCATYGYANPGYADTLGPFARDCLVPPGDIAGLASLLERCLKDPEEYVYSMGYRQKEYFNQNYDLDQVGPRALTLYQD